MVASPSRSLSRTELRSGAGLGLGKNKDFIRIFEIQKQFLPAQTEVRFAEGKHKFEKFINQSFFFRLWQKAKR
jgi:hypothetical protein